MHAVAADIVGAHIAVPRARTPQDHRTDPMVAYVPDPVADQTAAPSTGHGAGPVEDPFHDVGTADLDAALTAARAGSEAGFVALYRDLQPRLLRYATALVGTEAEDVTAETWLHVTRDLPRFQGDLDGFRGWASAICRNRALDAARSRSRRPTLPTGLDLLAEHAGPGDTAGSALEAMSTRSAIALIAALPPDQAEAVLLRVVVGLDARTAATVLGKRPGAVRVAAHRGLRRLARTLDEAGYSGA